jgi:hypothetical protein
MPVDPDQSITTMSLHEDNEQLSDFLLASQRFLMNYPQASRELVAGLVEEGRRYAQTTEGQVWMDALANSELVKRSMLIWEAFGLDLMMDARPTVTPSSWLEMIVSSLAHPDLESILSMLIVEEMRHGNFGPS